MSHRFQQSEQTCRDVTSRSAPQHNDPNRSTNRSVFCDAPVASVGSSLACRRPLADYAAVFGCAVAPKTPNSGTINNEGMHLTHYAPFDPRSSSIGFGSLHGNQVVQTASNPNSVGADGLPGSSFPPIPLNRLYALFPFFLFVNFVTQGNASFGKKLQYENTKTPTQGERSGKNQFRQLNRDGLSLLRPDDSATSLLLLNRYAAIYATMRMLSNIAAVLLVLSLVQPIPALAAAGQSSSASSELNRPDNSQYTRTMRIDARDTPRALYNLSYGKPGSSTEQVARAFIQENAALLHIGGMASALHTESMQTVPGGSHIRFSQVYGGVPVYGADIVVSTNERNEIGMVINNFKNDISLASTTPSITPQEALRIASRSIQKKGKAIGKEDEARLMVYNADNGKYHLAYRVSMTTEDPAGDWDIFVDATTGTVLHTQDIFVMRASAFRPPVTGYVYLPDPLAPSSHRYNDPGFTDNNDADSDSLDHYRSPVQLDSLIFEDGVYKLNGPYCTVTDIESPPDPPFYGAPTPDGFRLTRNQPGFEAVNVYYHVSTACRRVEELGFRSEALRHLRLDPHGFQAQDNSHYSPSGNWISWGTGGVDDAEDATAIWHEYGHAIQYTFVPTWGGGETGALGEGFGDYWAASYARAVTRWLPTDEQYNWVFGWDGHNPFWPGRTLNDPRTYPFGNLQIHIAGQIWSSALMGIWEELGKEVTDRLVLKSLFYLGYGTTGPDNAQAILQADRDLYGGAHVLTLLHWLGTVKHFVDPHDFDLHIVHTPLESREGPGSPIVVRAEVSSSQGPALLSVRVVWGCDGTFSNSAAMRATQKANEYECELPWNGKPAVFQYYIVARDEAGRVAVEPEAAPAKFHVFQAGVDVDPPMIVHTPAELLAVGNSRVTLGAWISDNTQIDAAWVEYAVGNNTDLDSAALSPVGTGTYEATIDITSKRYPSQSSFSYRVLARDRSARHNLAVSPASGFFTSQLIPAKGVVLLVDDNLATGEKGATAAEVSSARTSAVLCERALKPAGLVIQRTTFASLDTSLVSTYDAIVLLGGQNLVPFNDPVRRSAIVRYVRQGGKVIVEGGEVGSYYRKKDLPKQEVDAQFRSTILHVSTFVSDASAESLTPTNMQHRLWSFPNAVPCPVELKGSSTAADKDVMSTEGAERGTYTLAEWSSIARHGGIIAYTDGSSPTGCNTVFFTFCLASISDSITAAHLISNTLDYLITPRTTSIGSSSMIAGPPGEFSLSQNYPNPFNPTTRILFSLPEEASVSLKVYNTLGQEISTLIDAVNPSGTHVATWNSTNSRGERVSSGTYLYRLETRATHSGMNWLLVRKMILTK